MIVIGDSFIESQMNRYDQTVQGRLNEQVGGSIPVYGFGFAGNSLAEYLAIARMAHAEFTPVALVIVIIDNDVKESWQRRIGHRYFAISESGTTENYWQLDQGGLAQRIRQTLGDSALYRYIQVNLSFTLDAVIRKHTSPSQVALTSRADHEAVEAKSRLAIDFFLQHLTDAAGLSPDRIVLVFDSDRERIYDPTRSPRISVDSEAVQSYLKTSARNRGYVVVDMAPVFAKHYAENHRRFDFSPIDRHWSAVGHGVVADEVLEKLKNALCGIEERLRPKFCGNLTIGTRANQQLGKKHGNE